MGGKNDGDRPDPHRTSDLVGASDSSMLAALEARPARDLTGAELVDAITRADRLLSAVTALQAAFFAEFARPGRAGDVTMLVETLCEVGGAARHADGSVDPAMLEALVSDRAEQLAAAEVGAALNISPLAAGARIDHALELVDQMPTTWAALRSGAIDRTRARMIADRTRVLPAEQRCEVERLALELAPDRAPGRLRHLIDRAVITADPEAAQRRAEAARQERGIDRLPAEDSMSVIRALLPAEDAASVFTMIDLLAKASPDPDRTIGQRRADALSDLAEALLTDGYVDLSGFGLRPDRARADAPSPGTRKTGPFPTRKPGPVPDGLAGPICTESAFGNAPPAEPAPDSPERSRKSRGPTRQGRQVQLTVTIAASTLAGLDRLPAQLSGCGAITAELAAMLAKSASSLTAVVVDPTTGGAEAIGATVYRPRQRIRDHAVTAADVCRFPGCRHPSVAGDLDHRDPFDHVEPRSGGRTTAANIDPLCRAHHLVKHRTSWSAVQERGNGVRWQSPTGHSYLDPPREFTLPGEWQRASGGSGSRDARISQAGHPGGSSLRQDHAALCVSPFPPGDHIDGPGSQNPLIPMRMKQAEFDFASLRATALGRIRSLALDVRGERRHS